MKSLKLLASLLFFLSLASCGHKYKTSDWQAGITLPASQDCYLFNVMSGKETRYAANDPICIAKKERSIWLDLESYRLLRGDITNNCFLAQCKQITGGLDHLFLTIDASLRKVNKK